MMLPEMDGIEICRKICKLQSLKKSYIIVLAENTEKEFLINALEAGVDDYLIKPFSPAA